MPTSIPPMPATLAAVEITSDMGEKETVRLEETLAHSILGIFTGSLQLKAVDKAKAGNLDSAYFVIETLLRR